MSPIHVETVDIPSYAASKVMTMITITGAAEEAVRSLVVLAEAEVVSEAEAASVEAALAEAVQDEAFKAYLPQLQPFLEKFLIV